MKNSTNYRYFAEASENSNEEFLNIQGFADDQYAGFDSELLSADASPAQTNANAATSAPFIVSIANSSTSNVSNVLALGANQNLVGVTNFGNPSSISITMGSGSVTYAEFLFQTQQQPFTVGLTYLQSTNTSQILTAFTLQHKEATGRLCQDPIIPVFDPYQNLQTMTITKRLFTVDGNTMLTFNTIYASATLNVYLYPSNKINIRNGLLGASVESAYANPKIVQGQTLNVSSAALQALKSA